MELVPARQQVPDDMTKILPKRQRKKLRGRSGRAMKAQLPGSALSQKGSTGMTLKLGTRSGMTTPSKAARPEADGTTTGAVMAI